jgi:hypothetical protein
MEAKNSFVNPVDEFMKLFKASSLSKPIKNRFLTPDDLGTGVKKMYTESELMQQLTESLTDSTNKVEVQQDYRRLVASYLCEADEDSHYLCTRYTPAPNGDCKAQQETDFGSLICLSINGEGS